jgi:hypothetical protein
LPFTPAKLQFTNEASLNLVKEKLLAERSELINFEFESKHSEKSVLDKLTDSNFAPFTVEPLKIVDLIHVTDQLFQAWTLARGY